MKNKFLEDTSRIAASPAKPSSPRDDADDRGERLNGGLTGNGIAKQMQMALIQDAESRQKNIRKTPIDFPTDAVKGGRVRAKAAFEKGEWNNQADDEGEKEGVEVKRRRNGLRHEHKDRHGHRHKHRYRY